ncbi:MULTISPECIES: hypothetical protein [unclassified Lentimicrobium]|uniref:hypothetical protein n=1 Tax=unclassified Lentimicrobium TaxID=2677434 RepID=UPI001553ED5A|nr:MULTISPECIES: hypothetical protein [unclassified Lentimicrobium]NPD44489.1 hypothetical protein [Lentimicrobium sp. S6]NPD84211.1 hypothetical protein [Lentimicrobium sp. L6]
MKNTIFIFLLSIIAYSCTNSTVFETQQRFEDNNWFKFDEFNYEIEVDAGQNYSFDGTIITDSNYKNRKMELGFYLYLPEGGKRLEDKTIRILDFEYQALGKKADNGFELPVTFKQDLKIKSDGLLKIKIILHSQHTDNFGIVGFNLSARKTKP